MQYYDISSIRAEFMKAGADEVEERGWLKTFVSHCN